MMKIRKFTFEGKEYPAGISMGAFRMFRRETGTDFLKLGAETAADDIGVLLWCAVKSRCRVDGIEFPFTCEEFLDRVTPDEVSGWYVGQETAGEEEEEEAEEGDSKKKGIPG